MKYYDLDIEEQVQLDEIESTKLISVNNLEEIKRETVRTAKNSLNKTMNINIRLSERDVYRLKSKAAAEGIPYQTLASSILHKSAAH